MSRPTNRLKVWSVPPSSTSDRTATESMACINGYRNSTTLMGFPSSYRFRKSSRSSIRATVYADVSRSTSAIVISPSHSEFRRTSAELTSSTLPACSRYVVAFVSISSSVRNGRVSDWPEGSPTRPVKSPTMGTAQGQLLLKTVPGDDVGGSGQQARKRGGGHRIRDATSADTGPWL